MKTLYESMAETNAREEDIQSFFNDASVLKQLPSTVERYEGQKTECPGFEKLGHLGAIVEVPEDKLEALQIDHFEYFARKYSVIVKFMGHQAELGLFRIFMDASIEHGTVMDLQGEEGEIVFVVLQGGDGISGRYLYVENKDNIPVKRTLARDGEKYALDRYDGEKQGWGLRLKAYMSFRQIPTGSVCAIKGIEFPGKEGRGNAISHEALMKTINKAVEMVTLRAGCSQDESVAVVCSPKMREFIETGSVTEEFNPASFINYSLDPVDGVPITVVPSDNMAALKPYNT